MQISHNYPALKLLRIYSKCYPGIFESYEQVTSKPFFDLINETTAMLMSKKYVPTATSNFFYKKAIYAAASLICLGEWRKNRIIYSVSTPLKDCLSEMNDFEILPDIFNNLPHTSFFVECNTELFAGAFIKYLKTSDCTFLLISIISKSADKSLLLPLVIESSKTIKEQIENVMTGFIPDDDYPTNATKNYLFYMFQVTQYLASSLPDVVKDNSTQPQILKKKKSNKNVDTVEVEKWNVGYNFVAEKLFHNQLEKTDYESHSNKIKQIYYRKAHWRIANVGKGRNTKVLKLIPPTIVKRAVC